MKAQAFGVAVVALSVAIGTGILGFATIGTAEEDWRNLGQPRFNATARCEDGTWSWSKATDANAVCEYHGGVAIGL